MSEKREACDCECQVRDDDGKPWTRAIEFGTPLQWARLNRLYRMLCQECNGYGQLALVFADGKLVAAKVLGEPALPEN